MARKSRLSENIVNFLLVGLAFVLFVYAISSPLWSLVDSFLAMIVVIIFLPHLLRLIREEDSEHSTPQEIKAWEKFQKKRGKKSEHEKYSIMSERESISDRKKRRRRMVR